MTLLSILAIVRHVESLSKVDLHGSSPNRAWLNLIVAFCHHTLNIEVSRIDWVITKIQLFGYGVIGVLNRVRGS